MPKVAAKPRAKRPSVTDGMGTVVEKLASGVQRKLIKVVEQDGRWLVEPGERGHASYIYNIKDRLKADNFEFDGRTKMWSKLKDSPYKLPSWAGDPEFDTSGLLTDEQLLAVDLDGIVAAHYSAKLCE